MEWARLLLNQALLAVVLITAGVLGVPPTMADDTDPQATKSQGPFTGLASAPEANLFTGGAATSIPIDVPPGRRSLTPKIALTYTSGAGQSPYGVGWDLVLGKIQRSGKWGSLPCTNEDARREFVLTIPGANIECLLVGDQCVAKIEGSFVQIHYDTNTNSFDAYDPDGMHYVFGRDEVAVSGDVASRSGSNKAKIFQGDERACTYTHSWALTRIVDPVGNYISIQYEQHDNVIYPKRVDYGGKESRGGSGGTLSPQFHVDFEFRNLSEVVGSSGMGGSLATIRRVLKAIDVRYGQLIVRSYELKYAADFPARARKGRNWLLQTVTMYGLHGRAGGNALAQFGGAPASPEFEYYDAAAAGVGFSSPVADHAAYYHRRVANDSDNKTTRVVMDLLDMNADGYPDHVDTTGCNDVGDPRYRTWSVYLGSRSGFQSTAVSWEVMPASIEGKDDHACSLAYSYNNNGVEASRPDAPPDCARGDNSFTSYGVADLDGDAVPDWIDASGVTWRVHLGRVSPNGGGYFDRTITNWDANTPNYCKLLCNHNGCSATSRTHGFAASSYADSKAREWLRLIDWNGDGRVDLVNARDDLVYMNNGHGFDALGSVVGFPLMEGHENDPIPARFLRRDDRNQKRVEQAVYDMNGDGLPDYVEMTTSDPTGQKQWNVYFNRGGQLQKPPVPWVAGHDCALEGISRYMTPSSVSIRASEATRDLADLNGDGLVDLVDTTCGVYLNRGDRFEISALPILSNWRMPLQRSIICPSTDDDTCVESMLADIDGDGYVDLIDSWGHFPNVAGAWLPDWCGADPVPPDPYWFDDYPRPCTIPRTQAARADTLTHVENGIGGSTDIEYRPSDPEASMEGGIPRMPMILWTVTGVTQHSGMTNTPGATTLRNDIVYQGGKYDFQNREFRGFGTVYSVDGGGVQRTTTFYQDAARAGKIYETALHDAGADPSDGASAYFVTRDTWECATPDGAKSTCPMTLAFGERRWARLKESHRYDRGQGGALFKETWTKNLAWDENGNITGTAAGGTAPTVPVVTQAHFATPKANGPRIRNKPSDVTVTGGGKLLERRWLYYDGLSNGEVELGNATRVEALIVPVPIGVDLPTCTEASGKSCTRTDTEYDAYGNVRAVSEFLRDHVSYTTTTEYDYDTELYPATTTNAKGQVVTTTYDAGCGKLTTKSLPNSDVASTNFYDVFCRLVAAWPPLTPGALWDNWQRPQKGYAYHIGRPGFATEIYSIEATGASTDRWNYRHDLFDGLGRPLQTFRTASIDGQRTTVVENTLTYDARGNSVATAVPQPLALSTLKDNQRELALYQHLDESWPQTRVAYDAAGRVTRTEAPDGGITLIDHHQPWETTTTDPCYNASRCIGAKTVELSDGNGRVVEKQVYEEGLENEDDMKAGTKITYDGAGRTTSTKQWNGSAYSAKTAIKSVYDSLGRNVRRDDPDSGVWLFGYDALGNLAYRDDPNADEYIERCYDELNRVVSKRVRKDSGPRGFYSCASHPEVPLCAGAAPSAGPGYDPDADTVYCYDTGAGPYSTGRLTKVIDPTGETAILDMSEQGWVTHGTKAIRGEDSADGFRAEFWSTFDYVGHPLTVTYPDGEVITYGYDAARMLTSVKSSLDSRPLLTSQTYDLHGRLRRTVHGNGPGGNGVVDERLYDDATRLFRLTELHSTQPAGAVGAPPCGGGGQLLGLSYSYQANGLISQISDAGADFSPTCNSLSNSARYAYDGVGRLSQISGNYFLNDQFEYDTYGNATRMGGKVLEYAVAQPHQLAKVNGSASGLDYDDNGNRTGKPNSSATYFDYDPENHLISAQNGAVRFGYDYTGAQVRRTSADAVTYYFSNLAELRIAGGGGTLTKYYFAGGRRIAMRENPLWIPDPIAMRFDAGRLLARAEGAIAAAVDGGELQQGMVAVVGSALLGLLLITSPRDRRSLGLIVRQGQVAAVAVVFLTGGVAQPLGVAIGARAAWAEGAGGCPSCGVPTPRPPVSRPLHYHTDHLGSVQAITDANGNAVEHIRYKAYGVVRARISGLTMLALSDGIQSHHFIDYESEPVSGLYYAGARFYDPELGMFLTHDPVAGVGSPYLYSRGDPVNLADPNGADPITLGTVVLIGLIAGALASGIQAAVQGASIGEVFKAAAIGGAIGAVTAPIGHGLMQGVNALAVSALAGVAQQATVEAVTSSIMLTTSIGQATYGLSQGDYSGIIALGVSIGMASAMMNGGGPALAPPEAWQTPAAPCFCTPLDPKVNIIMDYYAIDGVPFGPAHAEATLVNPDPTENSLTIAGGPEVQGGGRWGQGSGTGLATRGGSPFDELQAGYSEGPIPGYHPGRVGSLMIEAPMEYGSAQTIAKGFVVLGNAAHQRYSPLSPE